MKSEQEYTDQYLDKYIDRRFKQELWRFRYSLEEFKTEIDKIREYVVYSRLHGKSEKIIDQNVKAMVSILLMDKMTFQEMKEQQERNNEVTKNYFKDEVPLRLKSVHRIKSPINFNDVKKIYSGLMRKQIVLDDLSKEVLEEFKNTIQYQFFLRKNTA